MYEWNNELVNKRKAKRRSSSRLDEIAIYGAGNEARYFNKIFLSPRRSTQKN